MLESCLLKLLQKCFSCGQEVKLNTSVKGTLLMVNGTCPDGHLTVLAVPATYTVGSSYNNL